jgi:AcrR family transcriptional regulator
MAVRRQGEIEETGRVNQKKRTRAAVVAAAHELVRQGLTPTVAQAAEAALVSRTTAYRYFPTQQSLLVELAVSANVDDLEALVAQPLDVDGVTDRAVEVVQGFNRRVLDDEVHYRTTLRLYLDQWLAAAAEGDTSPVVREGRRIRWLTTTLAPLRGSVPDEDIDRLAAALSVLMGMEAMSVLREVCDLSEDDALAITDWAARALIDAAVP